MKWKRLLLAFFILIVVVGFFYLYEIRGKREKQKLEKAERVLYEFQDQDIIGFTLSFQGEIVEASKQEDFWSITRPVQYPADNQMMEKFITALNRTRILEFIESGEDLTQYQLDPPFMEVTPKAEDPSTFPTLFLGKEIPIKGGYFGSLEGKDSVLVLSEEIEPLISASLFKIRDKNLLPYSKWDISTLKIKTGKGEVVFQKEAGGWNLTYPKQYPASEDLVTRILTALETSLIEKFVDEAPSDLGLYHLLPPLQSISFKRNDEEIWYKIFLGKVEEGFIYALRDDRHPVFLIGDQVLTHIMKSPEEFWERRISRRNRYSVSKFKITLGGNDCSAERGEEGEWFTLAPAKKSYSEGNVYALLASILEIKAIHFLDQEQWRELQRDLSEPIIEAEILGDQFQENIVLVRGSHQKIYAKNSGHPFSFYQVSQEDLEEARRAFEKCCGSQ